MPETFPPRHYVRSESGQQDAQFAEERAERRQAVTANIPATKIAAERRQHGIPLLRPSFGRRRRAGCCPRSKERSLGQAVVQT